jgi:Na+/melibiose symporter-like transporter
MQQSLKQIFVPFKDREYQKWLMSSLCMNTSMRMILKVLTPLFTFVLLFQGNEFNIFIIAIIPFAVIGFICWQSRAKTLGLRKAYIYSTTFISLGLIATILFLIPWDLLTIRILAFLIIGLILANLVAGYIYPNPIISALIDKAAESDQQNLGSETKKASGTYFGSYLFTMNIASAIGDLIIGFVLTGANKDKPILITLILPIAGLLYIVAILFFRKIRIPIKKKPCN